MVFYSKSGILLQSSFFRLVLKVRLERINVLGAKTFCRSWPIQTSKLRSPVLVCLIASLITLTSIVIRPNLLSSAAAGSITPGAIFNLDANDVNSISGASTTWKDLTGNGYDATLSASGSGYSISNDVTNKAIIFSNGTIVSQYTGASATIAKAIPSGTWSGFSATFSANMGSVSGGANNWSRVFDFSAAGFTQGSGAKGGIFISRLGTSDIMHLGFWDLNNTQYGECDATGIISNDSFAHYAVTVDSNGLCIWYKNGTAWRNYQSTGLGTQTNVNNGSTGSNVKLPISVERTSLRIGRSHWNDTYFSGSIRNLAVYNTTLSSTQVTANYSGQTSAYVADVKPTLASASINGTSRVGEALTAVPGAVTGSGITTSYQWQRANTQGGIYSDIGVTTSTYTPIASDVGKYFKVIITVTNSGGSASATSSESSVVSARISIDFSNPSTSRVVLTYKVVSILNITTSSAGKVTFFANGRRIPGCISIPATTSATCSYRPTTHGGVTLRATVTPNSGIPYSVLVQTSAAGRTSSR